VAISFNSANVLEGNDRFQFPYTVNGIIKGSDGKYPEETFKNKEDVWNYALELKAESEELRKGKGNADDLAIDVHSQLPFFCWSGVFLEDKIQRDINRYVYATELGMAPYPGSYGEQPAIWIEKQFLIKNMLNSLKRIREKKNA